MKKIALACDHAGFTYKEAIREYLGENGYTVSDFGAYVEDPEDDYPLFIRPAALAVSNGECDGGVILGGSGNGEAILANKIPRIRCAVCWNEDTARLAKEHNNANMISLGQRMISLSLALQIVDSWLQAKFKEGRYLRRILQVENQI